MRLFVGISVSEEVRQHIAAEVKRAREIHQPHLGPRLKINWVAPENYHFTLKFLGAVEAGKRVEEITNAIRKTCSQFPAFVIQCRGAGAFPESGRARNLWIGVGDGATALSELARAFENNLEALDFAREEKLFTPHLTIARVKEGQGAQKLVHPLRGSEFGTFTAREVLLYESKTEPSGPIYRVLEKFPLASSASSES